MEKILIINDDRVSNRAYEGMLTKSGYEVITSLNGKEGLKKLDSDKPDIILLDIMMPELDGFETAKEIRKNKDKEHLPIIFISSVFKDIESKVKGFESGGNDYLIEPVNFKELNSKIKALLREKKYLDELLLTKEKLEKSESKYRHILESISEGYYEVDLNGKITFCNDSACRIFGYNKDELIGMDSREYTSEKTSQKLDKIFKTMTKTGKPPGLVDLEINKKDGSTAFLELTLGLLHDGSSKSIGYHGVVRDVTFRKQAEHEIRLKNIAIENSVNAVAIADIDGKLTYVNNSFIKMWGFTDDDNIIGKSISDFWQTNLKEIDIMEDLETLGIWVGELSVMKTDGTKFNVIHSATKIKDENDNPIGIVSSFVDITMRKRSELALKERETNLHHRNWLMERDLQLAQLAHNELMKMEIPKEKFIKTVYRYTPLEKIGGDYFSFFPCKKDTLCVFIGDVSGHGVASALFLSLVKSVTDKISTKYCDNPSKYIEHMNRELKGNMSSYYITGIYGTFHKLKNSDETDFTFTNGGHPEPVLIRNNGDIEFVSGKNMVIGVAEEIPYQQKTVKLSKGDRLFLYTDGIPETTNNKNDMIGFDENLLKLFKKSKKIPIEEGIDSIIEDVNKFRGDAETNDDILMIGFEILQ